MVCQNEYEENIDIYESFIGFDSYYWIMLGQALL